MITIINENLAFINPAPHSVLHTKPVSKRCALLLAILMFAIGFQALPAHAFQPIVASMIAKYPERPHSVAPGTSTTFVVNLTNISNDTRNVTVHITPNTKGWKSALYYADDIFRPLGTGKQTKSIQLLSKQSRYLVAELEAPAGLKDGMAGSALVTVNPEIGEISRVTLTAKTRNQAKIYYIAIDSLGAGYLYLNRKGEAAFSGERLMPRTWDFLGESAFLQNAYAHLPAVTDPNHLSAMTGLWPGNLGLYHAGFAGYYMGPNRRTGKAVVHPGGNFLLKRGANGEPVQTIFDYLKSDPDFGSPDNLGVFISGKEWLSRLLWDGKQTVFTTGAVVRQPYFHPSEPWRMGDPKSDPNAALDRDGTNLLPKGKKKLFFDNWSRFIMNTPILFPDDRWIANSATQLIYAEDPDVMYIILGAMDDVQHLMGAADRPEEWSDSGTPNILWDDTNIFNASANRSSILDTAYEADVCFGMLLDVLKAKQIYDRSYISFFADHSAVTVDKNNPIDIIDILFNNGIVKEDLIDFSSIADQALIYSPKASLIENILEDYEIHHPLFNNTIKPFLVINRAEMDSGVDSIWGRFAQDDVPGNKRGELYSEWNIDFPLKNNTKHMWPDLIVFTAARMSVTTRVLGKWETADDAIWRGVHGSGGTTWIPLGIRGPGIKPGSYQQVSHISDITPTLYHLLGISPVGSLDGKPMEWILQ